MHVAILTAGGAGMFCGSCMHDNTWARAMIDQGVEVSLLPAYTPVRLDEPNLSRPRVFLGGINMYLSARSRIWRAMPRFMTRLLDQPWLINLSTKWAVSNDARELGELTLAMLAGADGPERRAVDELVHFLTRELRPDVIVFSNALMVGALKTLRQDFRGKIFCVLQGDDIFLEDLVEPYHSQAIAMMRERVQEFDGIIVHSRYYRGFMAEYLAIPVEKFHVIPLGIDMSGHTGTPGPRASDRFTVGYFARICPEKGLHLLMDAFEVLHARQPRTKLRVGGYLGPRDQTYFEKLSPRAKSWGDAFEHVGSPATHAGKVEFLSSLDVLSVPTTYREPKGLYVLEALANGTPVVQPRHGSFPELIEQTHGGILVDPNNSQALANALEEMLLKNDERLHFAREGYDLVRQHYGLEEMARRSIEIFASNS
ncbi:MAG: glycosyltransferase family 4 protein [Planctomycetaceae bacterium]